MDCCRTARRLGGAEVKVVVRSGFDEMKASPWEKEDAPTRASKSSISLCPGNSPTSSGRLTGVVFEKVKAEKDDARPPPARPDRGTRRLYPLRRRPDRGRPGERLSLDRDRPRHRVQRERNAGGRPRDLPVEPAGGVLRRRRGLRPEEHHHGGRARPRGGDLDRCLLPWRGHRASVPRRRPISSARRWAFTTGRTTTQSRSITGSPCRTLSGRRRFETCTPRSSSASPTPRRSAKRADASTATSRPSSRPPPASNATPASTSVRSTAFRSCRMRPRTNCACRSWRRRATSIRPSRVRAAQEPSSYGQGRGPLSALRPVRRALSDRCVGHAKIHHRNG